MSITKLKNRLTNVNRIENYVKKSHKKPRNCQVMHAERTCNDKSLDIF